MEDTFSNAFVILLIGMLTVFFILLLVMLSGNLLIRITNRFAAVVEEISTVSPGASSSISKKKIAAISAVISELSGGTAIIEKIEKID